MSRQLLRIRRSGAGVTFVLAAMMLAPGCRELTAPPEPASEAGPVGGVRILDAEGRPDVDVRVLFDGYGYADPYFSWYGDTDEEGFVRPELPPGRYLTQVNSRTFGWTNWTVAEVQLGEEAQVLDPRPMLVEGTLAVPEGLDPGEFNVQVESYLDLPEAGRTIRATGPVDASGRFRLVRPAEGTYDVTVRRSGLQRTVATGISLQRGTSLPVELDLVRQQVELELGGAPLPLADVWVRAQDDDGLVEGSQFVDDSRIEFWAPPGPGWLEISASDGLEFMRARRAWVFGEGPHPVVELGRHLIEFRFESVSGEALNGCTARVVRAEDLATQYLSGFGSSFEIHLDAGSYAVDANRDGYLPKFQRVEVSGAETVTIVMDPDP